MSGNATYQALMAVPGYMSSSALSVYLRDSDSLHVQMSDERKDSEVVSYYWDLFLAWPLLISSLVAGGLLFSQTPDDRIKGAKCAAIATIILLIARRRLALVIAVVALLASRLVVSLHRPADWRINIAMYVTGTVVLWTLGNLHESKSFRRMIRDELDASFSEITMADLLVNLAGLLSIFIVLYFLFH
jgi:hypothetical protein